MNTNFEPWRKTALEHLPMHSELVCDATSHVDLWQERKEIVVESNTTTGLEHLRPIFEYAWWCIDGSNSSDLATAIQTYFYEDLPAYSDTRGKIEHFIERKQFNRLRNSFSARINDEEFESLFAEFKARPN